MSSHRAAEKLLAAWKEAGREGEPKTMGLAYFALGDTAAEDGDRYVHDYYAWLGEYAGQIAQSVAKDAETVQQYNHAFAEAGCDQLFWIPTSSDPRQVDLLAEAAALTERPPSRYSAQPSFGLGQGSSSRSTSGSARPSTGTRVCSSESRSRRVTVSSSAVWPSTVTPHGVPISSWRR